MSAPPPPSPSAVAGHGAAFPPDACGAPAAIPEGLAVIPPGAELAQMLAGIDVERVSGFDTVEVLKAAYRQSCHERARFLRTLLEVGLREQLSGDSVVRLEVPDEFAPDEVRAALVWSRRRADSAFELAWNLHRRLPVLGAAMLAGQLDEPRAVAFIRWTSGLTDAQAGWVCEHLIGRAATWTVGELIEQIQRLVLAIDPDWAEKRYREAVRRRRVVGMRNDDGTATVSGLDLPLERAVAGCERIDELARACKRAGDHRPVDHIRADLFLGSLDGSFEGLSDAGIIAHVRTRPFLDPCDPTAGSPDIPPTDHTTDQPADHADRPADHTDRATDEATGAPHKAAASTGDATDDENGGRTGHTGEGRQDPSMQTRSTQATSTQPFSTQAPAVQACSGQAWSVREIRVGLTTLLGLDEHPAHLPGWGMVHAAQARRIVASMVSGEWRYAICTDDGHLLLTGITGRRPCPREKRPPRDARRGGIVELQVTLTRLHELAATPDATGAWARLIADLARHASAQLIKNGQPDKGRSGTDRGDGDRLDAGRYSSGRGDGERPESATDQSADTSVLTTSTGSTTATTSTTSTTSTKSAYRPGLDDSGDSGDLSDAAKQADRRHADAALRRYVQVRGRVCSWPGCRMPATRTDQDHIQAWADNGTTTAGNLHLACRHDHRAKHLGGWRVTSAGPHLIVWTSPLGHSYLSPLPKIIYPAPEPWPRDWPDAPPERLPSDLPGAPGTIMAPSCPSPATTGGSRRPTSGQANGDADGDAGRGRGRARGSGGQVDGTSDNTSDGSSFWSDREVPPF
ncbi:DUF222 domain-containing protein [Microbispora sp. NPDC004025]